MTWVEAAQAQEAGKSAGENMAPSAETPEDARGRARERFERGVRLYEEGDYGVALEEFQRAYQLAPSYVVLYNIGQLYFQLDRFADAYRSLRSYLELGGDALPPERVAQVRADIEALELRTARLHLTLDPATADITLDGQPVEWDALAETIIDVGTHHLHVAAPGFMPHERTFRVAGGDRIEMEVQLKAAAKAAVNVPTPPAPSRLAAAVATPEDPFPPPVSPVNDPAPAATDSTISTPWLVTGGLAAGWLTLALFTLDARAHSEDLAGSSDTREETLDAALRRTKRLAIATDLLLAATLGATGVSLYLGWDTPPQSGPTPGRPRAPLAGANGSGIEMNMTYRGVW